MVERVSQPYLRALRRGLKFPMRKLGYPLLYADQSGRSMVFCEPSRIRGRKDFASDIPWHDSSKLLQINAEGATGMQPYWKYLRATSPYRQPSLLGGDFCTVGAIRLLGWDSNVLRSRNSVGTGWAWQTLAHWVSMRSFAVCIQ
jgi:hypothetical protein